jgi:hypothetical protein
LKLALRLQHGAKFFLDLNNAERLGDLPGDLPDFKEDGKDPDKLLEEVEELLEKLQDVPNLEPRQDEEEAQPLGGGIQPGVNVINLFSYTLTKEQNRPGCLSLISLSSLVLYLQVSLEAFFRGDT